MKSPIKISRTSFKRHLALSLLCLFGFSNGVIAQQQNSSSPFAPSGHYVDEPNEHTLYRWSSDFPGKSNHQRGHYSVLRSFRDSLGNHWMSTVRILEGEQQLALGVIVDKEGWVVSKSSELPDGDLVCRLHDSTRIAAHVVSRRADLDLALLKIERSNVPAIEWDSADTVTVGGFLASTDSRTMPLAIGVVSVKPRTIRASQPVLGVRLEDGPEGVIATHVLEGGGAARAGVIDDDLIVAINGQESKSVKTIQMMIAANRSGDRIKVTIKRDGKNQDLEAQLTDMSIVLSDPTEAEVNGKLSARASDFASAFQHDTVLTPNQCGGPVVDLRGKIVGLNIARAGRVHCYALPMDVLVPAVDDMLQSASLAFQRRTDGDHVLVDSRMSDQLPKDRKPRAQQPSIR